MNQNLLNLLNRAQPTDIIAGVNWYQYANDQAARLAKFTHRPLFITAAVIAVISPRCRWEVNLDWAWRVARAYVNDTEVQKGGLSPLFPNIVKALEILRTGDVNRVSGQKVSAFYDNILEPQKSERVTIDSWAYRAYLGLIEITDEVPHSLTPKRYKAAAADYVEIALTHGYKPCELQAIIWTVCHRLEGKGA